MRGIRYVISTLPLLLTVVPFVPSSLTWKARSRNSFAMFISLKVCRLQLKMQHRIPKSSFCQLLLSDSILAVRPARITSGKGFF
ncbi:hypothetical protein BJX99DRAFT_235370 [Aspergillus californicus]